MAARAGGRSEWRTLMRDFWQPFDSVVQGVLSSTSTTDVFNMLDEVRSRCAEARAKEPVEAGKEMGVASVVSQHLKPCMTCLWLSQHRVACKWLQILSSSNHPLWRGLSPPHRALV